MGGEERFHRFPVLPRGRFVVRPVVGNRESMNLVSNHAFMDFPGAREFVGTRKLLKLRDLPEASKWYRFSL